jgi:hypothetical protein
MGIARQVLPHPNLEIIIYDEISANLTFIIILVLIM